MSEQIIWDDGHGPCVGCVYEYETCCHYNTEVGKCDLDEDENNDPTKAATRHYAKGVIMIQKYRKKPVVIEALKWTGENLKEVIEFIGWHESAKSRWSWQEYEQVVKAEGLKIFTLEGTHMATIGDMIIKGVHGEFYPCKPDIFVKTYELA